jgi:hypothetical protein
LFEYRIKFSLSLLTIKGKICAPCNNRLSILNVGNKKLIWFEGQTKIWLIGIFFGPFCGPSKGRAFVVPSPQKDGD